MVIAIVTVTDAEAASIEARLAELSARMDGLATEHAAVVAERDEYRKLYLQAMETCRKLELGLMSQKRERLSGNDAQLTM